MTGWFGSPTGTLWPTQEQRLVLTAAVGPEGGAVDAFRAWRRDVDLSGHFERDIFRLLPLVYNRMHTLGLVDPLMGRLKGVYRLAWYRTQALLYNTTPVIAALQAAGIDTILLKGVPLVLSYYRNHAIRPMADIDVMVPLAQVRRAMTVLEAAGWECDRAAADDDLAYRHAWQYRNAAGDEIDLHWHLMPELCTVAADREIWSACRELIVAGTPTRQLDPAMMLLHLVVHGVRFNREPPVRWIADAMTVLRSEGDRIDWERLVGFARTHRLAARLGLGLEHLAQQYDAPIPAHVLARLRWEYRSLTERIENSVLLADYDRVYGHLVAKPWVIFAEYCRRNDARDPIRFLNGLSHYARYRWHLRGRREILPRMLRAGLRRLTQRRQKPAEETP